jgi:hypothetical protein
MTENKDAQKPQVSERSEEIEGLRGKPEIRTPLPAPQPNPHSQEEILNFGPWMAREGYRNSMLGVYDDEQDAIPA